MRFWDGKPGQWVSGYVATRWPVFQAFGLGDANVMGI